MYQIYFLSLLFNLTAGAVLAFETLSEKTALQKLFVAETIQKVGFRFGLGILTFIVGFLKLLSVTQGDVPVVGDLLPAVSGMVMGFTLILQYYQSRSSVSSQTVDRMDSIFTANKNLIGLIGIIIAVLHFFLPRVLFL
jgi:hypothetical protein